MLKLCHLMVWGSNRYLLYSNVYQILFSLGLLVTTYFSQFYPLLQNWLLCYGQSSPCFDSHTFQNLLNFWYSEAFNHMSCLSLLSHRSFFSLSFVETFLYWCHQRQDFDSLFHLEIPLVYQWDFTLDEFFRSWEQIYFLFLYYLKVSEV